MPYIHKTKEVLTKIPPECCTRKEAAAILGLSPNQSPHRQRIGKKLHYTYVRYKNKGRIILYSRAEVMAAIHNKEQK